MESLLPPEDSDIDVIDRFDGSFEFLSNFSPAQVTFNGLEFPTVEHAYQAAKTDISALWLEIQKARTPGVAKRMGRIVPLRPEWSDPKFRIETMRSLLKQKFANPSLQKKLLMTGDEQLVEGNNWGDTFWGVCKGVGENNLGKLLMEIREELK
jgi:ribA/ribD-fused uncharacterized protein